MWKKYAYLILGLEAFLLLMGSFSFASNDTGELDSCYYFLNNNEIDRARVKCNAILESSKKKSNIALQLDASLTMAAIHQKSGEYNVALEYYFSAIGIANNTGNQFMQAEVYNSIGTVYMQLGDYANALNYYLKSLAVYEAIKDNTGMSKTYNNLGTVFHKQENYEKALEFYNKSLSIEEKLDNDSAMVSMYINIGVVYQDQRELTKALDIYNMGIELSRQLKLTNSMAILYHNMGIIHDMNGDSALAATSFLKSLEANIAAGSLFGQAENYIQLGKFYNSYWDYKLALTYLLQAMDIARQTKSLDLLKSTYEALSDSYSNLGKFKEAFEAFQMYKKAEDMINDNEKIKKFTQLEMQYDFDKKQKEQEFAMLRQRIITGFSIFGMLLMVILAVVVFLSYRRKQRDNLLLEHKNKEIEAQRDEIFQQKKEIMDSIYYARRIQNALLPPEEVRNSLLPDHFVLYLPRDVVSGDFFWVAQKGNRTVITAADCTGHGVPGAFMSMLGIAFLTEIVNRPTVSQAAQILDELRSYIIRYLRQTGKEGESKDGMDMALVIIDKENNRIEFAGAHNPLYLIRNNELTEYKADRMPIGYYDQTDAFMNHTIDIATGDTIYFFSDGYVDQFGGESGKKFRSRPFKELLLKCQEMNMHEQREFLLKTHQEWKRTEKQIDDILVIGMRF